ncbi:hypothetical protein E8E11_010852 [Didymella keratinophila]|nr:hypothetical protein E8E11_010852 [Didymella keratinophila]
MYQWYWKAAICYVYLSDVHVQDPYERFKSSRWFTRGWTLQELLAPAVVEFYDAAWNSLGSKSRNVERIKAATQIHGKYIENRETIQEASISTKFSWASSRETTRVEDAAYCILGLVQVNMPMLYGEGKRAFYRLQLELLRKKHDHTIFTWSAERGQVSGVLAPSLSYFSDSDNYSVTQMSSTDDMLTHDVTNNGLRITLLCRPCGADGLLGRLNCVDGLDRTVAIELRPSSDGHHYQRRKVHALYGWGDQSGSESHGWTPRSLYLNIDEDYSIETDSRVHPVAIADIRPKYDYNINGVSVSDHQKVDIVRRRYNEENPLNADVAHKQRLFVLQQLYCSEDLTACVRIGSALWTPTYQAIIFGLHHERPMIHHTIDAGGAVKKNWFVELHANPSRYVRDHARFTNDEYVVEVKAKKTRGTNGLSWTLEVKAFEE